jgi:hypothetical protein
VRKSARLLEASSSKLPVSPPASLQVPLESTERFSSLPPPALQVQALCDGFQVSLQGRGEDIGEYNADYFDSQEGNLCAPTSSSDDLEEDEFIDEDYASNDSMSIEEY